MANSNLDFTFTIQDQNFSTKLNSFNKQLRVLDQQVRQASQGVIQSEKDLDDLSKKYQAIKTSLDGATKKVQMYVEQMQKQSKSIEDTKNKLTELKAKKETLNKAYEESVKSVGKEAEATQKIVEEQQKLDKQIKSTEKSLTSKEKTMQNYTVELEKSKTRVKELETQLKQCGDEVKKSASKFLVASEKLQDFADKTEKIGGKIDAVSDKILKIGTAFVGAGTAIAKFQMDFEDGIAQVSTLLSDGMNLESFERDIIDMSNKTGVAVQQLSSSVYEALSSGVPEGGVLDFIEKANKLSVAGFADISQATDILTSILNSYGMELEEVNRISDVLLKTQDLGKVTIDELQQSMGKLIPTASANGVALEQIASGYALMTSNGIACAESTTYMNSMLNELSTTSSKSDKALKELSGKGFKDLMSEGKSLADVLIMLEDYAKQNNLTLSDMFGSSEAGKAGLVLVKEEGKAFNDTLKEMQNSLGQTEKSFEKINSTQSKDLQRALNELKNAFLDLGDNLVPVVEKVTDGIQKIADVINNLSDEQIDSIIQFGKWTLAVGAGGKALGGIVNTVSNVSKVLSGISKVVGGVSTAFSGLSSASTTTAVAGKGLATALGSTGLTASLGTVASAIAPIAGILGAVAVGFYAVHEAQDVANSSCIKAKEEYSGMEKAMAKLMGIQLESRKELEKSGVIYEEFSKNVSKDFRNAVEDMRTEISNFSFDLRSINFDGVFSEEELNKLSTSVSTAVDKAIETINSKSEETQQAMMNLFNNDGVFSEREKTMMEWYQQRTEKEVAEVQKLHAEINEIEQKAFAEGRALTAEEIEAIEKRYEQIKQIELSAQITNNDELLLAEKKFETQVTRMSAEEAQKRIGEEKKASQERIDNAYADTQLMIANLKEGYDDMSEEDKRRTDEMIKYFEDGYDKIVEDEEKYMDDLIKIAIEKNSNLAETIDFYTGEIMTQKQQKRVQELNNVKAEYEGLNTITRSGLYTMRNTVTGEMEQVAVVYDEKFGEIVGIAQTSEEDGKLVIDRWCGYNDNFRNNVKELANSGVLNWNMLTKCIVDSDGKVVTANGQVVGSLQNVTKNTDGTRQAFITLGSQKYKINVDEYGAISVLDSIITRLNNLRAGVTVKVRTVTSGFNIHEMTQERYAKGSAGTPEDGYALINEQGFELVDTPVGTSAYALSRSMEGDLAYIPQGTRISTHLTSTQQMEQAVKQEVNQQVANQNKELVKALNDISKMVEKLNNANNTNIDVNDIIDNIVIDNILNLTIDGKQLSNALAPYLDRATSQFNKSRRK